MRISSAIAQLRTTDVAGSVRFYTTKVGLTLEFHYEDFYVGIRAGDQIFHLKLVDEKDPSIEFADKGEHFHLYLETDDAAAAAELLKRNGVRHQGRSRAHLVFRREPIAPATWGS